LLVSVRLAVTYELIVLQPHTALVIPAAYHASKLGDSEPFNNGTVPIGSGPPNPQDPSLSGLLAISRGTALLLLVVYIAYLIFQLKTHADLYKSDAAEGDSEGPRMNAFAAGFACAVTPMT
jgi:Ca2+:H+ antiporter